jgi:hypothetical protein
LTVFVIECSARKTSNLHDMTAMIDGVRCFVKAKMRNLIRTLCLGLSAVSVAGCAGSDTGGPLRSTTAAIGFSTTVPEAKDFVRASRPSSELAYVPVGREPIIRQTPSRSAGEVAALQQQLDQVRDASESAARRALPTGAYGRALPSVSRPATPAPARAAAARPAADGSYPVNPNRVRQMRENAQRVQQN